MDAHPAEPPATGPPGPHGERGTLNAVIVTGGDAVSPDVVAAAGVAPDLVIAADSGLDIAVDLGLSPTVLVGDLDSVSSTRLAAFRAAHGEVIAHPTDKDDTDLALAIGYAIEHGATRIDVLGGAGRRLSHVLGNCAAISHAVLQGVHTRWHFNGSLVQLAAPHRAITVDGAPGDLVSLLPFGGPTGGVTTTGLRWSLNGDTLDANATRGVSNELVADRATVAVDAGLLLVIHERNHDT